MTRCEMQLTQIWYYGKRKAELMPDRVRVAFHGYHLKVFKGFIQVPNRWLLLFESGTT